jgi:hypothetical protein
MTQRITPLPWRKSSTYYVEDNEGRTIAECHCDDGITLQEAMRNAAYIAQACDAYPQLVEALKEVVNSDRKIDSYQAIAKAAALLSTLEESK